MHNNSFFKFLLFVASVFFFVSCDKEYSAVGDALIGDNNFELAKYTSAVIAHNEKVTPIQSSNLQINALGIYDNPAFGKTTASFATQVTLASQNPTFGSNPVIDSVMIDVPYFSTVVSTDATTGNRSYVLDSIYGEALAKIKLSVYESGRYMGTQNATAQTFYTNQNAEFDNLKIGNRLNDDSNVAQNDAFFFNPRENRFKSTSSTGTEIITRTPPSMRLKLNANFFKDKIINAPAGSLVTNDVFINYFKGLYFKVEQSGADKGSLALINFAKGNITIKYKEDTSTTDATKVEKILTLNLSGISTNFLEQSNTNADYANATSNPNRVIGDEKLYLKGGEGSLAVINLFGSADNFHYEVIKNASDEPIDENGNVIPLESDGSAKPGYFLTYIKKNTANGVSDELDNLRFPLIDDSPGQIYHSIKKRWLINDANLVFYIDTDVKAMGEIDPATGKTPIPEPERLYLYDYTNSTAMLDYLLGVSTTNKNTSKFLFGGFIKRDETTLKRFYKFNITNHIRDLVKNTSAKNIKLGLVVTEDINIANSNKLKTANDYITEAPKASVMNPLGTILFGGKSTSTDPLKDKRLKLEITYTKPK